MLTKVGLYTFAVIMLFSIIVVACTPQRYGIEYLNDPCIKPYKGYTYQTCSPFLLMVNKEIIFVPMNFKTDLASIPRLIWPIVNPAKSELMGGAIVHDYLYQTCTSYTRKQADIILYSIIRYNHGNFFKSAFVYWNVRLFGWMFYKGNDNECRTKK